MIFQTIYPTVQHRRARTSRTSSSAARTSFGYDPGTSGEKPRPALNILRLDSGYQLELALPGLPRESIAIDIQREFLRIRHTGESAETSGRYTRREFSLAGFERRIKLHENADVQAIEARFEAGILFITIPDRVPEIKTIDIQ